jgi:uncharacterized protein YbjT (DUF2867 family)
MPDKKIIAVVGATGAQGGGLADAILEDRNGPFALRALTRDPDSAKAKALAERGAQVVRADTDDPASVGSAFDGAWGAFCVTNFWEHMSPERELQQARHMAQAAKSAALQHVVWSTLEDTRQRVPLTDERMPTLMGKYKVPHFDAKGEADPFFRDSGVPVTFFMAAFYWENFIYFGMGPQRGPDGVLGITFPMDDKLLPGIAAQDIGRCAYGIFKAGPEYVGKTVGVAGEQLTGQQMADAFTRALGQPVRYNAVSPQAYAAFGFPGADDLANMFQFKRDFNEHFCAVVSPQTARRLHPGVQDFAQWLEANKARIPLG